MDKIIAGIVISCIPSWSGHDHKFMDKIIAGIVISCNTDTIFAFGAIFSDNYGAFFFSLILSNM